MACILLLLRLAGASIWTHLLSKPIVDSFLTAGALVMAASQVLYCAWHSLKQKTVCMPSTCHWTCTPVPCWSCLGLDVWSMHQIAQAALSIATLHPLRCSHNTVLWKHDSGLRKQIADLELLVHQPDLATVW